MERVKIQEDLLQRCIYKCLVNYRISLIPEIQNQNANVIFIGITNNPIKIGQAVKKFDKKIYFPLPDQLSREVFFRINISKISNSLTEEDFQILSERTEGLFSPFN
jgi:SpoVK/Ycf46/Vps4 family AAA+-type ATPase